MSWNASAVVRSLLYGAMIVMLWYASHLQMESQVLIGIGTSEATQALRLSAIMIMEQNEYQILKIEEQEEEHIAQEYHHAAYEYNVRAKYEREQAVQSRTRSDYYEHLVEVDSLYENMTYQKMMYDDHVRLELFQNISQDEDAIAATRQEDIEMGKNPCHSWLFFESVCTMLHIIPNRRVMTLEKEVEMQTLVQEHAQLNQIQQEEYVYALVTTILQGYVTQYNHTAQELLQSSIQWDQQMKQDERMRQEEDVIAQEYDSVTQNLQSRLNEELVWQETNRLKSNTLFHQASYHMQLSRNYRNYSIVIAVLSFLYFVTRWSQRFRFIFMSLVKFYSFSFYNYRNWCNDNNNHNNTNDRKMSPLGHIIYIFSHNDESIPMFWRTSYLMNYGLIFVVVCGYRMDMIRQLDTFNMEDRILFITSLAFCTAMIQTTLLHALPNIIYSGVIQCPMDYTVLRPIGCQFLIRMVIYTISSAIEFIIMWLLDTGKYIVNLPETFNHDNIVFVPIFIVTITLHICLLEKCQWHVHDETLEEEATCLMNYSDDGTNYDIDDVDDELSIATSIDTPRISRTGSKASTSPTERMPFIFMNGLAATSATIHLQQQLSTYIDIANSLNLRWEVVKLLLLVDTLCVTCSFVILRSSNVASPILISIVGIITYGVVITAFIYYASVLLSPKWTDDERRVSYTKSINTYNSLDV